MALENPKPSPKLGDLDLSKFITPVLEIDEQTKAEVGVLANREPKTFLPIEHEILPAAKKILIKTEYPKINLSFLSEPRKLTVEGNEIYLPRFGFNRVHNPEELATYFGNPAEISLGGNAVNDVFSHIHKSLKFEKDKKHPKKASAYVWALLSAVTRQIIDAKSDFFSQYGFYVISEVRSEDWSYDDNRTAKMCMGESIVVGVKELDCFLLAYEKHSPLIEALGREMNPEREYR